MKKIEAKISESEKQQFWEETARRIGSDNHQLSVEKLATEGVEEQSLLYYPRQMINEPFASRLADGLMECIREKRGEQAIEDEA